MNLNYDKGMITVKLTQVQLSELLNQTYVLTQAGYSLLESMRIVRLLADSSTYLPFSRIIFDLEEGYPPATAIGWNSEPLPDSLRWDLQRTDMSARFVRLLPSVVERLRQNSAAVVVG